MTNKSSGFMKQKITIEIDGYIQDGLIYINGQLITDKNINEQFIRLLDAWVL